MLSHLCSYGTIFKNTAYKDISVQVMATAVDAAKRFLQRQRESTVFNFFMI